MSSSAKKSSKLKISNMFAYAFVFVVMLILNLKTPLVADDFSFSLFDNQRITSFSQVFESMYRFYFYWSGRVICTGLAQIFLMYDKSVFSIFNTFVFVLLIFYIIKISTYIPNSNLTNSNCANGDGGCFGGESSKSVTVKAFHILLVFAFLLLFTPAFGQDCFWLIGSFNYLAPTLFLLVLFDLLLSREELKFSNKSWLLLPLFFIGGASYEGIGATLLAIHVLLGIKQILTFRKVSLFYALSFACSIFGFLFLVLAPGNFARLQSSDIARGGNIDRVSQIIDTFLKIVGWYFDLGHLLIPAIFIVICIGLVALEKKLRLTKKCFAKIDSAIITIFGMLIFASTFCYTVAPELPYRVQFLGTVFAAILCMYFAVNLKAVFKETVTKAIKCLVVVACVAVVAVSYRQCYRDNRLYLNSFARIDKSIEEQMAVDPNKVNLDLCLLHIAKSKFSASYMLIPTKSKYNGWIFDAYFNYKNYKNVKLIDCDYEK